MNSDTSRRTFLLGLFGSGLTTRLVEQPEAGASPPAPAPAIDAGPRMPNGLKLRGLNHVGSFDQASRDTIWGGFWRTWDWASWIRPQLDDIAKVANAVRFWGNTLAIADGSITTAQYITRWEQALDYARSLGLLVYPCGGDLRHWGNFTWSQSTDAYSEWAGLLSGYTNVIGVDITNEASSALGSRPGTYSYRQSEPADQLLLELSGIVRNAGLPVAHSRSIQNSHQWSAGYFTDHLSDFLDFHVYYQPSRDDSLSVHQQPWSRGKRLIVGEFGQDTEVSSVERSDYYQAIKLMCNNDSRCVGAFAWSAWDLGQDKSTQWGLFDGQRNFRSDIGTVFLSFPEG